MHVKRIHEYKRQLLNLLHTVALYQAIAPDPGGSWVPRVKIFAGKAAASYHQAKLIIKLTNDIANTINADPTVRGLLRWCSCPTTTSAWPRTSFPRPTCRADFHRRARASGTSNMKFALNGALTIGTLDGANVEMSEQIGLEHMFIFGLTAQEVNARKQTTSTTPRPSSRGRIVSAKCCRRSAAAVSHRAIRVATSAWWTVSAGTIPSWSAPTWAYWQAQLEVEERWRDPARWWRSSVLNTARTGWFSSDRTIREYAREIWKVM